MSQIQEGDENSMITRTETDDSPEKRNTVRVIVCRPGECTAIEEIGEDLASMQAVVGGMIQEYQPFYDESDPRVENVIIYCHEEGKLRNLERNRAIADPDGRILDIIRGPFFIAYAPVESENFLSIPDELREKYFVKFRQPERFFRTPEGIKVVKFDLNAAREHAHEQR